MKKLLLILAAAIPALLLAQLAWSNGTKTVTTSGTPVRITANNVVIKSGTIQALHANTGTVCVGGASVSASSRSGICLTADQATPLFNIPGFPFDLSAIYIDSTVNGEGVSYTYAQ